MKVKRELDPHGKRFKKANAREDRRKKGTTLREEYHQAKADKKAEAEQKATKIEEEKYAKFARIREENEAAEAKKMQHIQINDDGTAMYASSNPQLSEMLKISPLRCEFSAAAEGEVTHLSVPAADNEGKHKDLTGIELITIDPETARDFDDAVFAEPDTDPTNEGGMNLVVAIADVAHYVRYKNEQGHISALNQEALEIGNSTYPPSRVIPMLPEAISNELCSLKPNEERAAMVMDMRIDKDGQLIEKTLKRGIIKSRARLTYRQAQNAIEEQYDTTTQHLSQHIDHLYSAYKILQGARDQRKSLNLEAEDLHIQTDFNDGATAIVAGDRLESQKLIEEMMIIANVAAAQLTEKSIYRVHPSPPEDSVERGLKELEALGVQDLPEPEDLVSQDDFNALRERAKETVDIKTLTSILVRMQAKAEYKTTNGGHYGLDLQEYSHFTSPIRRYSDLMQQRLLIAQHNLGDDGISADESKILDDICNSISLAERRSDMIERVEKQQLMLEKIKAKKGNRLSAEIYAIEADSIAVKIEGQLKTTIPFKELEQASTFKRSTDGQSIHCADTGSSYTIGETLEVEIQNIDPKNIHFDFVVVGRQNTPHAPIAASTPNIAPL